MKNILAENLLRFGVKNLKESDKEKISQSTLNEQTAVTAGELEKNPDLLAMGKVVASLSKGGKLPFNQLIEYAGKQLYCRIDPRTQSTSAGGVAQGYDQLDINVYLIAKSKFGCPVPKYIGACKVQASGKVSRVQDMTGAGTSINDNSLLLTTDQTKIGFVGFDSSSWDSYATTKFEAYVNNITKNPGYLKVVGSNILTNANAWKAAKKPTGGMAALLQKIVDAIINA